MGVAKRTPPEGAPPAGFRTSVRVVEPGWRLVLVIESERPPTPEDSEPGAYGLRKADIHRSPSRSPSCAGRDLSGGATFWTNKGPPALGPKQT